MFFFCLEINLAENCTSILEVHLSNKYSAREGNQGLMQTAEDSVFILLSPIHCLEQAECLGMGEQAYEESLLDKLK